jgi:hypothetical protein
MAEPTLIDYINSALEVTWQILKYFIIFIICATLIFIIGVWVFLRWLFGSAHFSNGQMTSKDYLRMSVRKLQSEVGVNIF